MPRLFIAIDPPPEQRKRIKSICTGLPGARWVPPEQVHLTMRFIGEVDETLYREITDSLGMIETEPMSLKIEGIGQFPPRRAPRVLWLGLEENDKLIQLRNRIESALVRCGLEPEDRRFSPHITIARFKKAPPANSLRDYLTANNLFELPSFPFEEFKLYSSKLNSAGAIHRCEASYPIKSL